MNASLAHWLAAHPCVLGQLGRLMRQRQVPQRHLPGHIHALPQAAEDDGREHLHVEPAAVASMHDGATRADANYNRCKASSSSSRRL